MKRLRDWLDRQARRLFVPRSAKAFNEHLKQTASFLNSLSVAMLGFAVVRPLFETSQGVSLFYGVLGLALHGVSHYVIGKTKED